jgi:hypothetical protein
MSETVATWHPSLSLIDPEVAAAPFRQAQGPLSLVEGREPLKHAKSTLKNEIPFSLMQRAG